MVCSTSPILYVNSDQEKKPTQIIFYGDLFHFIIYLFVNSCLLIFRKNKKILYQSLYCFGICRTTLWTFWISTYAFVLFTAIFALVTSRRYTFGNIYVETVSDTTHFFTSLCELFYFPYSSNSSNKSINFSLPNL